MPAIYSAPPQRYDYEHVAGDTFNSGTRTLSDAGGTAYDISTATGEVQLRSEPGGSLAATGTWALTTDGTDGKYAWSVAAATMAALSPGRYRYAERLTIGTTVKTIVEGTITLKPSLVA